MDSNHYIIHDQIADKVQLQTSNPEHIPRTLCCMDLPLTPHSLGEQHHIYSVFVNQMTVDLTRLLNWQVYTMTSLSMHIRALNDASGCGQWVCLLDTSTKHMICWVHIDRWVSLSSFNCFPHFPLTAWPRVMHLAIFVMTMTMTMTAGQTNHYTPLCMCTGYYNVMY